GLRSAPNKLCSAQACKSGLSHSLLLALLIAPAPGGAWILCRPQAAAVRPRAILQPVKTPMLDVAIVDPRRTGAHHFFVHALTGAIYIAQQASGLVPPLGIYGGGGADPAEATEVIARVFPIGLLKLRRVDLMHAHGDRASLSRTLHSHTVAVVHGTHDAAQFCLRESGQGGCP